MKRSSKQSQRHWLQRMDETEPQDRPGQRLAAVLAFNAPPVPEKRR